MSVVGLWASSMVLIIYNTLHQQLPACTIPTASNGGIAINCEAVLSSPYSAVFGIPLEVLAIPYFAINLALIYIIGFGGDRIFRASLKTLFVWRFFGLLIVPYLLVVELLLVKAICLYCTTMHISIIVDFAIISYFLFYKKDFARRYALVAHPKAVRR